MKNTRTFTIEDRTVEIETIKAMIKDDSVQDAILIHEGEDDIHDGDYIIFGNMPETADDALNLIENEYCNTCFYIDENGTYIVED